MSGRSHLEKILARDTLTSKRCVDEPRHAVMNAGRHVIDGPDGTIIGSPDPIDRERTRHWAIASLFSAGLVVGYSAVELVNRETGRAHTLHIPTAGLSTTLPPIGESVSNISYTLFETATPVNFARFAGIDARVTSLNAAALAGYSIIYLTLWDGRRWVSDRLAYVRMGGWTIASIPGGMVGIGRTFLSYGSGRRTGTVPLTIEVPPRHPERGPLPTRIQTAAMEGPRIDVPGDVLFEFDSTELTADADELLLYLADLLNDRLSESAVIEGHTDSIGDPAYNLALSRQRAEAVKRWFVGQDVLDAEDFTIEAYGETDPVAPNKQPDGSDNPEGRAKNRRVTIVGEWNFPE